MVISVGATYNVGKDTLFSILKSYGKRDYRRYAFADALKLEIRDEIIKDHGFDILTCTVEQKNSVRHLLVELGRKRREEDPLYWVKNVYARILADLILEPTIVPFICDLRYLNEYDYGKQIFGNEFKYVHLTRDGYEAANEEELVHSEQLRVLPEAIPMHWGDVSRYTEHDLNELSNYLEEVLS